MAKINKEDLAVEVEKYSLIYDKANVQYKNCEAVDQAWAQITTKVDIEGMLLFMTDAIHTASGVFRQIAKWSSHGWLCMR